MSLVIKQSPGKGLGVFALKKIKTGAVVAVYPLLPYREELKDYMINTELGSFVGEPYKGEVPSAPYKLGAPIAHMFNDAARLRARDTYPGLDKYAEDAYEYTRQTMLHSNVYATSQSGSTGIQVIARRNIKPGEELLLSYFFPYWNDKTYKPVYAKLLNYVSQDFVDGTFSDPDRQSAARQMSSPQAMEKAMLRHNGTATGDRMHALKLDERSVVNLVTFIIEFLCRPEPEDARIMVWMEDVWEEFSTMFELNKDGTSKMRVVYS